MSAPVSVAQANTLGQFGKHFQEVAMQALLSDRAWAEQMVEVFDVQYFELNYLKFLASRYFDYARKYKVFPTLQLLVTIIRDELKVGTDAILRDQIIEYLTRIKVNPNMGDIIYVKEKALEFCRKQALKRALTDAVDQMNANKYEQIVEGVKKAVMVGTTPALGHDFFADTDARFTKVQRSAIPTGIDELDCKDVLNGGLGTGELGVIVACAGVGKSHFLTMLGCAALRRNKNVLHYTFELSETSTGLRYDSNLCDINSSDIIENKEKVLELYNQSKMGRLIIKGFPMNTATIYTLRAHIERLEVTRGFTPDMLIIDYADIMRSTRQFDSLRHELKLIYEELRSFADEKKICCWTASQSNRDGSNSDIVDLTNMSEAYGKAMVGDVILSISRKPHEKASGAARLFVAKNRAGRDGLIYPIQIDTARSKFTVSGKVASFDETSKDDEENTKKLLREKLRELDKDKLLHPNQPTGN